MNKILLCFAFIVFPYFLLPLNQYNKTGKKVVKNSVMFGQYTLYQVFIFETIRREDYRAKPYRCPAGYLTCGIGCVIDSPKEKRFLNGITYEEAKSEVSQQFDDIRKAIEKDAPKKYTLKQKTALSMLFLATGKDRFFRLYPFVKNGYKHGNGIPKKLWLGVCGYKDAKTGQYVRVKSMAVNRSIEWAIYTDDREAIERRTRENIFIIKKRNFLK